MRAWLTRAGVLIQWKYTLTIELVPFGWACMHRGRDGRRYRLSGQKPYSYLLSLLCVVRGRNGAAAAEWSGSGQGCVVVRRHRGSE